MNLITLLLSARAEQPLLAAYSSEPLFSGETGFAFLWILILIAFGCLPAAVCFRAGKKELAAGCLALGVLGAFLFVPLVIAAILATRSVPFPSREESAAFRNQGRMYGAALLLYGIVLLVFAIRDYSALADLLLGEFYRSTVLSGIIGSVLLCVLALGSIAIASAPGKKFWGWYMAMPGMLAFSASLTTDFSTLLRIIGYLLFLAGGFWIWWTVFQAAGGTFSGTSWQHKVRRPAAPFQPPHTPFWQERPSPGQAIPRQAETPQENIPPAGSPQRERSQRETPQSAALPGGRATGHVLCLAGQYASATFTLQDGEALCFGTDPVLAQVVLSECQAAPLHLQLFYDKGAGSYLLAHDQTHPVYRKGYGLIREETVSLPAGAEISLGTPEQVFRLL